MSTDVGVIMTNYTFLTFAEIEEIKFLQFQLYSDYILEYDDLIKYASYQARIYRYTPITPEIMGIMRDLDLLIWQPWVIEQVGSESTNFVGAYLHYCVTDIHSDIKMLQMLTQYIHEHPALTMEQQEINTVFQDYIDLCTKDIQNRVDTLQEMSETLKKFYVPGSTMEPKEVFEVFMDKHRQIKKG